VTGIDPELDRSFQEADRGTARSQELTAPERENRDRSMVTGTVMAVFALTVSMGLLVLLVGGLFTGNWVSIGPIVADILKSVVLPVVTLVLGYYFGRGGKS
jgi:hypothetical protein